MYLRIKVPMSLKKVERAVEFLERLGLNENDIKVYVMLIDAPLLSIGEIQQSLGSLDLILILQAIDELVDIGLVRAVEGDIKRYYANLPFLREAVTVERETIFALDSLVTSIEEKMDDIQKRHQIIENVTIQESVSQLEKALNSKFFNPVQDDIKVILETLDETLLKAYRSLEQNSDQISEKLTKLDKDLTTSENQINSLVNAYEIDLSLKNLISNLKSENESLLKKSQNDIRVRFISLKSVIDKNGTTVEEIIQNYLQFLNIFIGNREELKTKLAELPRSQKTVKDLLGEITNKLGNAKQRVLEAIISNEQQDGTGAKILIDQEFEDITAQLLDIDLSALENIQKQQEKMVSDDITQITESKKSASSLTKQLDEMKYSMKDQLDKIGKSISDSLNNLHEEVTELLDDKNELLEEAEDNVKASFETTKEQMLAIIREYLDTNKDIAKNMLLDSKESIEKLFNVPKTFLETTQDSLQPLVDDEKENIEKELISIFISLHDEIKNNEDKNYQLIRERIKFAKSMLEGRGADLRAILKMSSNYKIKAPVNTGIVLGLPAIYATLSDLVLRAKRKVVVVTPTFDEGIFDLAIRNRSTINYTIVTEIFPEKHKNYINKAKDIGTISFYNYPDKDLFACFRDDLEIVFGYIVKGEEVSAVRSTQGSMIDLFKDRFNETIIRKAKKIV